MLKVFTLLADWLTYEVAGLAPLGRWADAMHFFVEDVSKILVLVTVLIFVIGVLRAGVDSERIRDFLSGKRRGLGYAMASGFGAVTPFCSCSSIPLFLGFTAARIPLGITMAFLITSPMINEVAIVLMGGLLGWRFLAVYVAIGLGAGMLGGAFLDRIGAERYLMPVGQAVMKNAGEGKGAIPASGESDTEESKSETSQTVSSRRSSIDFRSRLDFAAGETKSILKKIWDLGSRRCGIGCRHTWLCARVADFRKPRPWCLVERARGGAPGHSALRRGQRHRSGGRQSDCQGAAGGYRNGVYDERRGGEFPGVRHAQAGDETKAPADIFYDAAGVLYSGGMDIEPGDVRRRK
jgi:uncharacterized membrane protein YraQ (UPF0718 family)